MDKQEEIIRRIEDALLQGRWALFDRLPPERTLAKEFGVNRGTLRAALCTLVGQGLLETRRGSGTVVRALPADACRKACTLSEYVQAFQLFMPPLLVFCLPRITPAAVLELECLLPTAGASLRDGDMKTFFQVQVEFFSVLLRAAGNPYIEKAAFSLLPDELVLERLLQSARLHDCESLFAQLAWLLSALRRSDAENAAAATLGYAAALSRLQEDRLWA
jgi:GntR family transcriptional repressor for pyruvate dehydrogenase complex